MMPPNEQEVNLFKQQCPGHRVPSVCLGIILHGPWRKDSEYLISLTVPSTSLLLPSNMDHMYL